MKAVVYTKYGSPDVLQLEEVVKPIAQDDEVLVRVHATTVNRTDCAIVRAKPFFMRVVTGLFQPKKQIPGTEFAGEIEVLGKNVSSLKVGDRVFGVLSADTYSSQGYLAQNIFLPLITLIIKPAIGNKKTVFPFPIDIKGSMRLVKSLIEQDKFQAVIDREFSLEQIVNAYKYVELGHKKGNVVVIV